jgi:hypothetical protein
VRSRRLNDLGVGGRARYAWRSMSPGIDAALVRRLRAALWVVLLAIPSCRSAPPDSGASTAAPEERPQPSAAASVATATASPPPPSDPAPPPSASASPGARSSAPVATAPGPTSLAQGCAGLDYCACKAQKACKVKSEGCLCPCDFGCPKGCVCACGGGKYLGCEPK